MLSLPRPVLGFDTETELIRPGCQAPHLICAAFSDKETAELVHWTEARPYVVAMLESDYTLVGHNIAYDMGVCAALWPELLPLIFSVYEADRITDTGIRDKLQHIGLGVYRGFERVDGAVVKLKYSLGDVAERRCGIKLEKEGGWRLRYGELKDVPLAFWPEEARQYALGDPIATLMVYEHQEGDGQYLLEDQFRQTRAEWWLHLMSCWGLHTDEAGVQEFARLIKQKYDRNCEELIAADLLKVKKTKRKATGLVEVEIQRNTKAAKARMEEVCRKRGVKPDRTAPSDKHPMGQIQLDSDCCERSEDPLLIKYSEQSSLSKQLSTDIPLLEQGMYLPIQPNFEVLLTTGRTASSPNVQNLPTSIGMRECFVPRFGHLYASADYSQFELRTVSQVLISCVLNGAPCRLAEALNTGIDPHLEIARRILGVTYEEAKAKQKSQDLFPGTNETWKSKVYYARQASKVLNFGRPGGIGPERLVHYARNNYGVILVPPSDHKNSGDCLCAACLVDFWTQSWPEFQLYFKWIGDQTNERVPRIKQLFSNRYRGDVGFTDACNTMFQGLAADAAKAAGFLIAKACYVDSASPLFGARMVNFVHDEFILEVRDDDRAADAAEELARLMVVGASPFLPDVPPKVEPQLARRWSKQAETIRDEKGRLIPWDFPGGIIPRAA